MDEGEGDEMSQALTRSWRSAGLGDEGRRFEVDLNLRDRQPTLVLSGEFTTPHAWSVLDGILLRLDQINAPVTVLAAEVSAFDTRAGAAVLDAAVRRHGRGHPPVIIETMSEVVATVFELIGVGSTTPLELPPV
jgi:anti-anti-sigma regulatory factor